MTSQNSGSSTAYGKQLGYAQIVHNFFVADAVLDTPIVGLSFPLTVPVGVRYVVEFFSSAVQENSGSTAGESISVECLIGGVQVCIGTVFQFDGGVGGSLYLRSGTLVGDGALRAVSTAVEGSVPADGAIVGASATSPAYVRAVQV